MVLIGGRNVEGLWPGYNGHIFLNMEVMVNLVDRC